MSDAICTCGHKLSQHAQVRWITRPCLQCKCPAFFLTEELRKEATDLIAKLLKDLEDQDD